MSAMTTLYEVSMKFLFFSVAGAAELGLSFFGVKLVEYTQNCEIALRKFRSACYDNREEKFVREK